MLIEEYGMIVFEIDSYSGHLKTNKLLSICDPIVFDGRVRTLAISYNNIDRVVINLAEESPGFIFCKISFWDKNGSHMKTYDVPSACWKYDDIRRELFDKILEFSENHKFNLPSSFKLHLTSIC